MSNELQSPGPVGVACYGHLLNVAGQVWDTIGLVYETATAPHVARYKVTMTEDAVLTGLFFGDMPAGAASAFVTFVLRRTSNDAIVGIQVAPTADQNAAAWGVYTPLRSGSRDRDYFVMGGFNKTVINSTSLTVYSTDDTTVLATAVLTQDGTRLPIASVDP